MKKLFTIICVAFSLTVLSGCKATPVNQIDMVKNMFSSSSEADQATSAFLEVVNKHSQEKFAPSAKQLLVTCDANNGKLSFNQYSGQKEFSQGVFKKCRTALIKYAKKGDTRFEKAKKGHVDDFFAAQNFLKFVKKGEI